MTMTNREVDHEARAARQRAATRTAIILAVIAVTIYAWVFISKLK